MKTEIINKIRQKTGIDDIVNLLAERLSGSELNSLLLEVFNTNLKNLTPAMLLKQYQVNRFVHPAEVDMVSLLATELKILKFLQKQGFQPIELSPAAQLGSCSVIGPIDQKKVISATRNTEILSDATNSIALYIAALKKSGLNNASFDFCTIQRHIRSQVFKMKGHTAHFKVGCMVSSGKDAGDYSFESVSLRKHILVLSSLLKVHFAVKNCRVKLLKREGYNNSDGLFTKVTEYLNRDKNLPDIICDHTPAQNNYYKGIQFKMIVELNGSDIEIADGGFVDWTQQLLENKKERMLISGFGFELLYKIKNGLII